MNSGTFSQNPRKWRKSHHNTYGPLLFLIQWLVLAPIQYKPLFVFTTVPVPLIYHLPASVSESPDSFTSSGHHFPLLFQLNNPFCEQKNSSVVRSGDGEQSNCWILRLAFQCVKH